jgi:hypothetical protein
MEAFFFIVIVIVCSILLSWRDMTSVYARGPAMEVIILIRLDGSSFFRMLSPIYPFIC